MRNFITCFLKIILMMLIFLQHHLVASSSPVKPKTALFQFKQSLNLGTPKNCYNSVSCHHKTGEVFALDLSCRQLEGVILPNIALFQLSHLRFLNLFGNDFSLTKQFPQEFGFFPKGLTYLNLYNTGLSGRVLSGISLLYKLVSLDLSENSAAKLDGEVLKSLIQNLAQLRVLNLNWVNISSVLPVNLSTSLRVLNLMYTGLHGVLPQEVFDLPNIEVLALGFNINLLDTGLQAESPKVKWGSSGSLQAFILENVCFELYFELIGIQIIKIDL